MSKQTIIKSVFWVTISEIVFNLSSYIVHSAVGRILGPADYGRYGLVITLTTMIIILVGNGIPTAMAKYLSEVFETRPQMIRVIKKQAIISQSIVIGTLTLVFFLASPLIAYFLGDPTLANLFRLSSLIIPAFAAASFYFSYYTGLHKFNIQSALKISRSLFRLIFIIALAYFFHVEGSISGYIIAPLSVFLLAFAIDKFKISKEVQSKIQSLPKSGYDKQIFPWQNLVSYAWQIAVFFLAYELLISIDLYMVKGILKNDYLAGIYNAALTVGRIPYYVFYALTVILLPVVSKTSSEGNHIETKKIIGQALRFMLILLAPFIIIMVQFSAPIINIFYGSKFIAAAQPMSILLWGVAFLTIFYVLSFVMSGAGKTKIPMYISMFGLALNIVLNYALIPKYELNGSAAATAITSFIIAIIMLYFLYRHFKVVASLSSLAKIALCGAAAYFFADFFPAGNYIFIFWSFATAVFYFLLLYLLGEIKKEDLATLGQIVARKKTEEVKEELSGAEPGA